METLTTEHQPLPLDPAAEKERLAGVADWYTAWGTADHQVVRFLQQELAPFFRGTSALELGCSDGVWTRLLVERFSRVVVVDAAEKYVNLLRAQLQGKNIDFHLSFFEEFDTDEKFDSIFMLNILEHVLDPVEVMSRARRWLKPNGIILINVPNAESVHRKVGVALGMLDNIDTLNPLDQRLGHRRVYTWDSLRRDIHASGLEVEHISGAFLKVISNAQMEQFFTPELMRAMYVVGREFPRQCATIYAVCGLPRAQSNQDAR